MKKHRVLMLGPALSVKGGITTVEQIYLDAWDYSKYDLLHIGTFVDGLKIFKLLVFLRAFIQYCYLLIFFKPDILHIHFSWRASFYRKSLFAILARIFRVKLFLHCHASRFDIFYSGSSKIHRKFIDWILNSADIIIVVSEQWRKYFEGLSLRVPIHILYNPVACPVDSPQRTNSEPVVLSLGRLGERKGTYDTLKAIPHVLETCPNAEFWFGGDGDIKQVETVLSKELWGKHVRLLGWVQGKEKEESLLQASIFILPSYNEGLPIAILEAMAYSLPVVSTPVGGITEAVVDGKTGFIVEPGDVKAIAQKITLLLSNSELRSQIGNNGQRYMLEKFEVNVIIQQLFAIYDSLLSNS